MPTDPFGITYEGARQGLGTIGEALLQTTGLYAKRKEEERKMGMEEAIKGRLLEKEYQLKQQYPDPFTKMLMLQYPQLFGTTGQGTTQGQISLPSPTREAEINKIKEEGLDPTDFKIEPVYSTKGGIKVISGYSREEIPKKALGEEQTKALNATINGLSQLDAMEKLVNTGKVNTGLFSAQALPFGIRAVRSGMAGTDEDLSFSQLLRDFQNSYITAKTGAQRGFPEMMFLTIALPGGEMPRDKLLKAIQTSRDAMRRNYYEMLKNAKNTKRQISGYEKNLETLEQEFGTKENEISNLGEITSEQEMLINKYMQKYPNKTREEIIKAMQKAGEL